MGKRGGRNQQQWEEQQWEYADYSTSRDQSWQFWPGAWSPPKGQGKQQRNEFSFPAYDDKYRTQAVAKAASFPSGKGPGKGKYAILDATEEPADPGALLTQFLQEAINATRKAEQRVRSLAATRAQKVALWNRYVEDLKRSFMKEFQRHQRDTDRITSDLQAAMQQQEQARSHLRQSWEAVARGQYAPPRESSEATDTREWDAMLQEWRTEQQETDNSHAVLRRALGMSHGGAMDVDATGRTTADELFQTPPRRVMTQAPMTPPAVDHPAGTPPGLSRTVDPYMTSPGQAAMPSPVLESSAGVPAGVTDPGGNESHAPIEKTRPDKASPRKPVKKLPEGVHHPKASVHSTIADKLETKRAAQRELLAQGGQAMIPFRGAAGIPTPEVAGALPAGNGLEDCVVTDSDGEVPAHPSEATTLEE